MPCAARKGDEGGITARRRRLRRRRRPPPLDRRGLCAPRSPSRPLLSIALLSAAATRIEAALRAVVHDSTKVGACAAPGLGASIVVDETEELGRRSRSRAIGDASSSSRRPLSLSGCFLASRCVSWREMTRKTLPTRVETRTSARAARRTSRELASSIKARDSFAFEIALLRAALSRSGPVSPRLRLQQCLAVLSSARDHLRNLDARAP